MSVSIRELFSQYNHQFSPFWLDDYNWETETASADNYIKLTESINSFVEECFICFTRSLIQGEYIVDYQIIDDLEGFRSALYDEHRSDGNNLFKSKLLAELSQLTDSISLVIDSYLHFILVLKEKYRLAGHHYLVTAFSVLGRDKHMNKLLALFCNEELFLFQLEHNFSRSDSTIRKLVFTRANLEAFKKGNKESITQLLDILIGKCSFLLTKLLYEDGKSEYLLDFKHYVLPDNTDDKITNHYIDDFIFYYRDQYGQNESHVKDIQSKVLRSEELTYREFVLLAKYYKDSNFGTAKQYENLIKDFEQKRGRDIMLFSKNNYDVYALRVLTNYMYNCRLSFLLKNERINYSTALTEYNNILSLQNDTSIYNFYPHRRIVQYIIAQVKEILHSDSYDERDVNKLMTVLNDAMGSLRKSIKWCDEISFFPVVNIYNDCNFYDNELKMKIYSPSSFSYYVDYEKLYRELEDFEGDYRSIQTEYTIKRDSQGLRSIEEKIEDSRKRLIEVFGLFTTVVALIFGGISIFTNSGYPNLGDNSKIIDSLSNYSTLLLKQRLVNYFGFGFSLLLFDSFLLLLLFSTENRQTPFYKSWRFWLSIALCVISLVVVLICLLR